MLLSSEGDKARAKNSLRYAQLACSISDDAPHEPLWPRIHSILYEKGYVTEHGKLRMAELHDSYRKLFSAGFEDERLCHFVHDTSFFDCCIRAVRRADRAAPAPFLVLLHYAARDIDAACSLHQRYPSRSTPVDVDAALRTSKRARWLEQSISHQEMTRTQMRHSLSDVWSWLYRNDRPWLQEHQHPTGTPAGGRRFHEIPAFINVAINHDDVDLREHHGGREPLPSAYQTRLAYGMNEYLFNRLPTMPPAVGRQAQLPGLKELFVSRRVGIAVEQLARDGKPLDIATVSRAARLRIATVSKFGFKVSLTTHEIKATTSARLGSFYLKGGDAHAVPSTPPNSGEAQPLSESRMDAPESHASGDRNP
ncbi:TnsD family Tn7-like transposition protein [Paraburkholderia ginsengiterrae]|uniref:TnsD family Tn7-like transposition protein n=1 Tax=Paraburkholderia ginsengiterrae TaxID=1462993 RepID=UPI0013F4D3F7|nr:TnsD family Tn7-like transposition protein [Paraburkholderia ginsengiterrae]